MERLPIPIFRNGKAPLNEIDMKTPTSGVLADAHDILEKTGDTYASLHRVVYGATEKIGKIDDPVQIRELTKKMAYSTAEFVAIKALLMIAEDDGIDGIYQCPMGNCAGSHVAKIEYDSEGEEVSNSLDYLSDFEINCMEDPEGEKDTLTGIFRHDLKHPVELMDGKTVHETITSVDFRYPTLQDCMAVQASLGAGNTAKLQLRIYGQAIIHINGSEPPETLSKWKNRYAAVFMGKLNIKHDLGRIYRQGRRWGYNTLKDRVCPQCGNMWKEKVNPMGFFSSALREIA